MARTKQRTRIQDFIVTSGDVLRGEDPTAGAGTDLPMRGGNASAASGLAGGDVTVTGGAGDGAGGGGDVTLTPGAGGTPGSLVFNYATFPPADGAASEVLTTDGAGTLSWSSASGAVAGVPGNIYENLVFYVDSADNDSYPGTGTTVTDLEGNGTNGTLTGTTFSDGGWTFDAASGDLTFTKNATLDNIFDGGGTVIVVARPRTGGESNVGFLCSSVDNTLSNGWRLNVRDISVSRLGVEFEQTFDSIDGIWRTFDQTSRVDPEPLGAFTGVRPWELGSCSIIGVVYNNSAVGNDPTIYINGRRWTTTLGLQETSTPVGTRESDAANDLTIGNEPGDTRTWGGEISAVLMFDRELTPEEVCQVSNVFAQRYGIGAIGRGSASNDMYGQHVWIRGGRVTGTGSEARGGHISIIGGENDSNSFAVGGSVLIRAGHKRGVGNVAGGDLTLASGEGNLPSQVQLYCGTLDSGNTGAEDSVLIHGMDIATGFTGRPGGVTIRGGNAVSTGSNRGGGGVFIDGGLGDSVGGGGNIEIRSGGQTAGNSFGQTGEIIISTSPQATGGTGTQTEDISVLTEGGGATAVKAGRIFLRTGDYTNNGSISTSGATRIDIICGSDAGTAAVNDQGSINITAGDKAGSGRAGGINLTAGDGVNGDGGSIVLTPGIATGAGADGVVTISGGYSLSATTASTIDVTGADLTLSTTTSGTVSVNSADAVALAGAGQIDIDSGDGSSSIGEPINITTGAGDGAFDGGLLTLTAGDSGAGATGNGGTVTINAGDAASTNGDGGDIVLNPGSLTGSGTDGEVTVNGKLTVTGLIDPTGLVLTEQSTDPYSTTAGDGTIWVRDDTDQTLMFTDDQGDEYEIAAGGVRRMQEIALTVENVIREQPTNTSLAAGLPNGGVPGSLGQNINSRIQYIQIGKSTEDDIGAAWSFVLPDSYSGNGLTVEFWITGDGSASAAVDMSVAIDRQETGRDLNTGALWGAYVAATGTTVSATAWITIMATATLTNSQIDSMVAGESGRIAIMRLQNDSYAGVVRMTMGRVYETV